LRVIRNLIKNRALVVMVLPGVILMIMFSYFPMIGLSTAFRRFNYTDGIFRSAWTGFENFRFLFENASIARRIFRNTIGYYLLFTSVGTVLNVALAIALYECTAKCAARAMQTVMIMPTFISYVAVTYIVYAFLDTSSGLVNRFLQFFGGETRQWYLDAGAWPWILLIVNVWKNTGYNSILYLSALSGMDQEVFESAELDGATKMQKIRYITLPMLSSMISIMLLLGLGNIMTSNTGLFYQVTKNVGMLYETTQTIDAYVLNSLMDGHSNFGMTTAVAVFQSTIGCIMVVGTNLIVRRIEPENALF